jgi:hypothetical protein
VIGNKTVDILYDTVPEGITYATMLQVAHMFKRRKDFDLNSISMPDGSISTLAGGGDLLPEVKKVLGMYRKTPEVY